MEEVHLVEAGLLGRVMKQHPGEAGFNIPWQLKVTGAGAIWSQAPWWDPSGLKAKNFATGTKRFLLSKSKAQVLERKRRLTGEAVVAHTCAVFLALRPFGSIPEAPL